MKTDLFKLTLYSVTYGSETFNLMHILHFIIKFFKLSYLNKFTRHNFRINNACIFVLFISIFIILVIKNHSTCFDLSNATSHRSGIYKYACIMNRYIF